MPRRGRISGFELGQSASSESSCSDVTGGESAGARQVASRVSGSLICLVATISFVFATGVVLLVILTKMREKPRPIVYSGDSSRCVDVAVIGGGLAGCYTAWRLRQRDLSVHVYEMSNRIGGRLYTRTFPKIPEVKLELGGAYYVPARDRRMEALVRTLSLSVKRIKEQTPPQDMMYYIRDMFVTQEDLNTTEGLYNLDTTEESMLPRDLLKRILQSRTASLPHESLQDALVEGASPEAFRFLEATLPPTVFHADGNAQMLFSSMTSPDWTQDTAEDSGRVTLTDGMDSLPRTLINNAQSHSTKIRLNLGFRLKKLTRSDGVYNLEFVQTETKTPGNATTCAQRVVLALPPEALQNIEWQPLEDVSWLKTNLRSVTSVPATKVFLAFPKTVATDGHTNTPNSADTTTSRTTLETTQIDTTDYDTTQNDVTSDVTNDENDTTDDVGFTTLTPVDEGSDTATAGTTTIDTTSITTTTTVADTTTTAVNTTTISINTTVTNTTESSNNETNTFYSNVTYDDTNNGSDVSNISLTTVTTTATTHDCITPASTTASTLAPAFSRLRTDMPMRYVEDITSSADDVTSSTVLQAVFASGPHVVHWDNLKGGATFAGSLPNADSVSEKLVRYLRAYLNRLAPVLAVSPTAPPSDAVVQRWGASLPPGGAWHVWRPSFHWKQVSHKMLKPIPDDMVFIVGSAFATGHLQMYAEGALQTVDDMLLLL